MSDGYRVYRKYVALKLHFNSDYDFVEYGGAVNVNTSAYFKRRDKVFFEKLGAQLQNEHIVPFFVAQFMQNSQGWIGDMTGDYNKSMRIYQSWIAGRSSFRVNVEEDVGLIKEFLESSGSLVQQLFEVGDKHPAILRMYLEEMITIETLVVLERKFNFLESFKIGLYDPVAINAIDLIQNYSSFLKNFSIEIEL